MSGASDDRRFLNRRNLLVAGAATAVSGIGIGLGLAREGGKAARAIASAAAPPMSPGSRQLIPAARPRLGINLAGPVDWNTELPFVDLFRLARRWISQREGADWGKGPPLQLDDRGWIKKLEPGAFAETVFCTGGHAPRGTYTVLFEGEGVVECWGTGVEMTSTSPGRVLFNVTGSPDGIFLRLKSTNPQNPVQKVRVLPPGADAASRDPWNPTFLKRWAGVAAVRFMDFMLTNNSEIKVWSERPRLDHATFDDRGIPVEHLVDLANRLQASPWFCMPHQANDAYVEQFAAYVAAHLDPKLKAYIEYSNEVWNSMFAQSSYAVEKGKARSLSKDDSEANCRFYAQRSVEIFRIWERVFRGRSRLVRVLASQVNPWVARPILEWNDAARNADALAIAPYLHFLVMPEEGPKPSDVAKWSLDTLFTYLEKNRVTEMMEGIKEHKALADRHGLSLIAYEGGQHLVGVGGAENDERLTKLLQSAQRHPKMGDLYRRQYQAWTAAGGDLFCHFSSVSASSKWGSWGLLEAHDADPRASPKFMETMRWAKARGQAVNVPSP